MNLHLMLIGFSIIDVHNIIVNLEDALICEPEKTYRVWLRL